MSGIPIYFVDAFTSQPFGGNPAAVCLLESGHRISTDWMQQVAAEINLSETAFVDLTTNQLRWFTPLVEVDLCGHATLASAVALREHGVAVPGTTLRFETRSGRLVARLLEEGSVELDFPATPPTPLDPDENLQRQFPRAVEFHRSRFDLLVRVSSEREVLEYRPDLRELSELPYRGIILTSLADPSGSHDFVSRFFAPAVGVNEDPVTGSAHCCLAPYWGGILSRSRLKAAQLSPRGGELEVALAGDRVRMIGQAVLTIQGVLFPDADT